MGSIVDRAKRIDRLRTLAQLGALAILLMPFMGVRSICGPAFHCHSCPLSAFACPVGVLVNFSTLRMIPYVTLGILGAIGTFMGRIVCGWICPFGLLQDTLHRIPTRKLSLPPKLRYVKYALLVGLVLAVPFFLPGKPYTFCDFCPAATLESTIPWAFMGVTKGFGARFIMRISILVAVLAFATVVSRGFCRTLCPLGATYSLFNKFSLFHIRLTRDNCPDCGLCKQDCPVEIHPVQQMNTAECTRCLDCTSTEHLKLGVK